MHKLNVSFGQGQDERNSFAVAMQRMMRGTTECTDAEPSSVLWAGGTPLDAYASVAMAQAANGIGRDVVYINFEANRIQRGPVDVTVLAMRDGLLHRYNGCRLWSPADGGPALLLAHGKGCFALEDGDLAPRPESPVAAVGEGIERARSRLRRLAFMVSSEAARNYVTFDSYPAAA
ncbi:MAG: hypothetical protein V4472_17495 [Pseudomonadota bacterium]